MFTSYLRQYDPNRVGANAEPNPFLGDRSIRLCLHDIPMFKRQLRAILRASVLGDVRIMFPTALPLTLTATCGARW